MTDENTELELIPEPYNIRLPGGFHARLALTDEVTRGERRNIRRAAAAAGNAIIAWQRIAPTVLDELAESRSPQEVALEFELHCKAWPLTKAEKADLVRQSNGTGAYRELSAKDRRDASARLELDTRYKAITEDERTSARIMIEAIAQLRLGTAYEMSLDRLAPSNRDAIEYSKNVRVFSLLRQWDRKVDNKEIPLPTSPEDCDKIPDTIFDAIYVASDEVSLDELDVAHSAADIDSRNPDRLKDLGGD